MLYLIYMTRSRVHSFMKDSVQGGAAHNIGYDIVCW